MPHLECISCGTSKSTDDFKADGRFKKSGGFRTICNLCANGETAPSNHQAEIAPRKTDVDFYLNDFNITQTTPDYILRTQRSRVSSFYNYEYGLYEEAVDKDGHLFALLLQRKSAVMSLPWDIVSADSTDEAELAAVMIKQSLKAISTGDGDSGFWRDISEFLEAIPYGFAVGELLWGFRQLPIKSPSENKAKLTDVFIPTKILSRAQRRFVFDRDGRLKLRVRAGEGDQSQGEPSIYLPPRRFLVFRPYARHEDPFGLPTIRIIWWNTWFKNAMTKWWVKFSEKFGSPAAVATTTMPLSDKDLSALKKAIVALQQDSGIVLPAGVELQFTEAQRYGSITTFQQMIDFCEAQMSKAILGQTMTTDAPNKGARSLGEVHQDVASAITTMDARAIEALVNGTLIPWIMEFNMPGVPSPELQFNTDVVKDQEGMMRTLKGAQELGFPVGKSFVERVFNLTPAKGQEDTLKPLQQQVALNPPSDQKPNPGQSVKASGKKPDEKKK